MQEIRVFFDEPHTFSTEKIRPLVGVTGLYFIFLTNTEIQYPFGKSRLIYIGMSEKKTNSIGKRMAEHHSGQSGNYGLVNYARDEQLMFTYINFEMLKKVWPLRIEDLESYFIMDFADKYGVHPICNNRTALEIVQNEMRTNLEIDWHYFEKKEDKDGQGD